MDIQKEREAFENWWESFHNGRQISCDYVEEDNSYSVGYANAQWVAWQAKAQAVPEKDAVINKLSDQLYAQEMKASAARVLCETACELLDDYAHQDAMVILNDLEQAMKEPAND